MLSIERMISGWNLTRVIYLLLGSVMVWQSISDKLWIGVAFGGYFAAMGLFAFGCAAGNCLGGQCSYEPEQNVNTHVNTDV